MPQKLEIGFTGTREGLTAQQKESLAGIVLSLSFGHDQINLHHGDCVGADRDAVLLFHAAGAWIIGHPPKNPKLRARIESDEEHPTADYIDRNHAIVDCSGLLIGCPKSDVEELRSGTWATIRYARRRCPTIIIWPDGHLTVDYRKD